MESKEEFYSKRRDGVPPLSSNCSRLRLTSKRKVPKGGIEASDLSIDVQGSYISENRREYHVLIEDEDEVLGPFTLASHLTCLKAKSQG